MFASMPLEEFEQFMQDASGGDDLDLRLQGVELGESRYSIFHQLLEELDGVKLDGPDSQDALIHSLEMFDLACAEYGCDEEFLSAHCSIESGFRPIVTSMARQVRRCCKV